MRYRPTKDVRYDTRFWNVGMSVSQMVALLEVQKARLVEIMRNGSG
jgi:hypothetical protein